MSDKTTGQVDALKDTMKRREENFSTVVETYVKMVGVWLSATSPAISQAVSAFTIGFATFEGVQSYLAAPWYFALIIGAAAAWAAESIGFTAVDERDHIVAHNQRTNDPARHLDIDGANQRVNATFYATMAIVLVGEVVPSGWGMVAGTSGVPGFLFRCSLLLWPIVSRIGAQLYAARSVRLAADTSADDNELRTLRLQLTKNEMIAESDLKVKTQRQNAKLSTGATRQMPASRGVNIGESVDADAETSAKVDAMNEGKKRKVDATIDALYQILSDEFDGVATDDLNKTELGRRIGKSRGTVGNYLDSLANQGRIDLNGHVRVVR